ncbi:MAG TPA: methylated-DNA--[protein]-cysteine S-methyltransferase [Stellaceae bacterium]|nr:methylated-DNA--[protein]-cysteine S-methyltransferase [Stellaceae bacterium]
MRPTTNTEKYASDRVDFRAEDGAGPTCDARRETIRFAVGDSSLGKILVAVTATGICTILFGNSADAMAHDLQDRFPSAELIEGGADLHRTLTRVLALIEAPASGLDLPLDLRGTPFQRRVWQALREITPGATASYSEIAERIGAPAEAYAVGEACAANPIAVAIPCHRVLRKNGELAGYRWGLRRKRTLLAREAEGGKGLPLFRGMQ